MKLPQKMKGPIKVLLLVMLLAIGFVVKAKPEERPLHEIHAMMIFNFIKYIEWPTDNPGNNFTIGVYGDQELLEDLKKFYTNRKIKGHNVEVAYYASISEVKPANVIYLASSRNKDFEAVKLKIDGKPSLFITDGNKLGAEGSCINFVEQAGKLRFQINKTSVELNQLKISSQLMSMGILL